MITIYKKGGMRNEKSIIDFVGKHNFGGNSARGRSNGYSTGKSSNREPRKKQRRSLLKDWLNIIIRGMRLS